MKKTTHFSGGVFATLVACLFAMATSSSAVITYHEGYNGGLTYEADAADFASAQMMPNGLSENFSTGYTPGTSLGSASLLLSGGTPTYKANINTLNYSLFTVYGPEGVTSGVGMGTSYSTDAITITFGGGANVTAVGATFYLTGYSSQLLNGNFSVAAFDGTSTVTRTYTASGPVFLGFTSDSNPFQYLTIVNLSGSGRFAGFDNLQVGAAVPEASTWIGAGFLGILLCWQTGRRWFARARVA